MNALQQAIFNLLSAQASGKQNALTSDQIFQALTQQNLPIIQGRTQEQIRGLIGDMVRTHVQLIGSGNTGYYIITNRDEVIDTIMDLVSRSHSNLERAERLRNEWNAQNAANQI